MNAAMRHGIASFNPNGTVMDLTDPQASDINFSDMAGTLGKIARFNGICRGPAYSVGQHSVMGADALDHETGDKILAGYFLLHDGHEYRFGDWPKPSVMAIAHRAEAIQPGAGAAIVIAIERQKDALDHAIWDAAGIAPIHRMPIYARQVKDMDDRMCRAEGLAMFGPKAGQHLPAANRPPPRVTGSFHKPWPAEKAREAFLDRLERYLGIVVRSA